MQIAEPDDQVESGLAHARFGRLQILRVRAHGQAESKRLILERRESGQVAIDRGHLETGGGQQQGVAPPPARDVERATGGGEPRSALEQPGRGRKVAPGQETLRREEVHSCVRYRVLKAAVRRPLTGSPSRRRLEALA